MTRKWERFEAKVDPANGMFVGPDECHYDTEKEAVVDATISLCSCGRPEDVQDLLVNALRCIECFGNDLDAKNERQHLFSMERIENLILQNPNIAAEFVMQFLDDRGLLEHGGSVGGSWLSERGKQVVELADAEATTEMSAHEKIAFHAHKQDLGVTAEAVSKAVDEHNEWLGRMRNARGRLS